MTDVIVVGAGAAGLTAALCAALRGKSVLVLERFKRAGRKLLATGNGRCNIWNTGAPMYFGSALADAVLRAVPLARVEAFFDEMGLATVLEDGGRAYPACGQASAVLDALTRGLKRSSVSVVCDAPVSAVKREKDGMLSVRVGDQTHRARAVIVACGGMAGVGLGHDGGAYRLLTDLGHTLRAPSPALAPLCTAREPIKGLLGMRATAILTLCVDGAPADAAVGEMLFTEYGVSGVCVMQLARAAHEGLARGRKVTLYADFSPLMGLSDRLYKRLSLDEIPQNEQRILSYLQNREHTLPEDCLLRGLLPAKLSDKLSRAGLSLPMLSRTLSRYALPITAVRGMEAAQVTRGGIACEEFDFSTLQSKIAPGVYACGEMLDVDGDCGGYNLLFAWASGILCGVNA